MYPVLWSWGPVTIHTYGVLLAAAVLIAAQMAARRAGRIGATPTQVMDLSLWSVVGGLAGGRLVYVAQHWPFYRAQPWEILRLDHGGLVFYGGLLGGVATALWLARRQRLPVLPTMDLLVPSVALAQAIGRLGCFFNGCCYGRPTTGWWGVLFPGEALARHPTQLYESAALLLLAAALFQRARTPVAAGTQLAWYAVGYGAWRFAVEFLRGDNPLVLGPLTFSQVVSIPLIAAALLWLRARSR
ncbi:MAG: prolipoprotein diacylglyceryl transferase [Omnitrophica WOR_2 bacterium RIFCSPHIGHO2_02_FULL_68_15]|nr:MAG: prolipoprotein diacylglyceryl transferase [Omnitrophica WOR_2 bacterium RIFCSPHIGHO2_02_FULL_68_15]